MKNQCNKCRIFSKIYTKAVIVLLLITKTLCSKLCGEETYLDISNGTHNISNGDIYFNEVKYTINDYTIDENGLKKVVVSCKKKSVRKCCPFGFGYSYNHTCVKVATAFDPPVWNETSPLENVKASGLFNFKISRKRHCNEQDEKYIVISQITLKIHMTLDGQLYISQPGSVPPYKIIKGPDKYCIDTFVKIDDNGEPQYKLDALVCYTEDKISEWETISSIITATCMLISCVFILVTVAVYSWLPELRNLHGRVLMAYLLCLFVSFIFFATLLILILMKSNSKEICVVFSFIIYYFLLASFFWLNVMSFDIWWTFSGKRGINLEKLSTQARFCAYALYAFGVPTLLTVVMGGLEFSSLTEHFLLPHLRSNGCFLHNKGKVIYLYGPMVLVIMSNMIFYILTAMKITQTKKQTSVLESKDSTTHDQQRKNDQQRFALYFKLFILMGINWLLEVISAIYPVKNGFWIIGDAYNVLIGLTIFIIFVCKRKIFHLMRKRYLQLKGEPLSRNVTTFSRTASSRDNIRLSVRNSVNNNGTGQ